MDPYHDNAGKFTSKGGGGAVAGAAKALAGGAAHKQAQETNLLAFGRAVERKDYAMANVHASNYHKNAASVLGRTHPDVRALKVAITSGKVNAMDDAMHAIHSGASAPTVASAIQPKTPAAAAAKILGGKDHVAAHNAPKGMDALQAAADKWHADKMAKRAARLASNRAAVAADKAKTKKLGEDFIKGLNPKTQAYLQTLKK